MIISYFHSKKLSFGSLSLLLWLGLIGLVLLGNISCSDEDDNQRTKPPADIHFLEIETKVDMGSIFTVQDTLAAAGQDGNLYLWDWRDFSKELKFIKLDPKSWMPEWNRDFPIPENKVCTLLSQRWIILASHEEDDMVLIVREVEGQKEVNRWPVGKEWNCNHLRSTRNGKYVAVYLNADLDKCIEGVNYRGHGRGYRLGLISPSPIEIQWLPQTFFRNKYNLPILSAVAASEDGNYICVVGTCDGGWIMLADVVRKKVVWEKLPKRKHILYGRWTVAFNDVCFSPDGKRIYVAGNCGLFCFDTATGRIIKQWPMEIAESVAVSPDERLVAVGLPGYHKVYICDVNSANPVGTPVLRLNTGQHSVYSLAFSPDSKFLATEGVLNTNIKIWKMPLPTLETKTAAQKNE